MPSGIFTLKQQELASSQTAWSNQPTPAVDYLVVGGGAGGWRAGGGAGGLLTGTIPVVAGSAITVTIGAGSAGAVVANTTPPANGAFSAFGSVKADGGGAGGGDLNTGERHTGFNGASGGGGGSSGADSIQQGGQGIFNQGNRGGYVLRGINVNPYPAGGGGGAGTVGLNTLTSNISGAGGSGISSLISGTTTAYGGGGGGATYSGGTGGVGGVGGGGAGGDSGSGTAGTANTGGGGGGSTSSGTGGNGGSGVVIISYPDIYPAATSTTGSPTVSNSGMGAISFSGSSQYIQYADNAAFDVGSGDFTIEAWVYRTSSGRMFICGQSDSAGSNASQSFGFQINASNQLDGYIVSGTTFYNATAATTFPSSTWTHVALTRDGNTLRLYSGGTQVGTGNVSGITANNSSNRLGIGSAGEYVAALLWNGYITNFRIVKGTCLYPSGTTFTPSTTPLTAISGTSILLPANSGAFSADYSSNGFFAAAIGNSPTWVDSSPFSVTGYRNRVYRWTSSGSITF